MPNPFTNRNMIRDPARFFGRAHELDAIFSRLEPDQPQSVSVVGENRIGRSSLLERVRQTGAQYVRRPERYRIAYVDAMSARASPDAFRARVLSELAKADAAANQTREPRSAPTGPAQPSRQKLRQQLVERLNDEELRTLCFDLNVDYDSLPAQGKAAKARELILALERNGRLSELDEWLRDHRPKPATHGRFDATKAVYDLQFEDELAHIRDQGICPVVVLDEFESLTEHPDRFNDEFFDWLRSVLNRSLLTLVTASALALPEIARRRDFQSTFFGLFTQVDLGEFTRDEARGLLTQPSDHPFDEAHVQFIFDLAGGAHPLKLTIAADCLYQQLARSAWEAQRDAIKDAAARAYQREVAYVWGR